MGPLRQISCTLRCDLWIHCINARTQSPFGKYCTVVLWWYVMGKYIAGMKMCLEWVQVVKNNYMWIINSAAFHNNQGQRPKKGCNVKQFTAISSNRNRNNIFQLLRSWKSSLLLRVITWKEERRSYIMEWMPSRQLDESVSGLTTLSVHWEENVKLKGAKGPPVTRKTDTH